MNYKTDSKIDINALDIEVLEQPDLERRYIKQAALLKKEAKLADEKVKTVRSELILRANKNPQKCLRSDKATGPLIEAYYRSHKKYKKAKQEALDAEDAALVASDMKDMVHFTRAKALEELITLHGQGYFAGPRVPRNINRELEKREKKQQRQEKTQKRIGSKMKRNK